MDANEAELLNAARHGDDGAFGQIVGPYLDRAYGLALRILEHRADAEDAVQDALYKAWKALPHFRGDAKFSTWLYRIVWRSCMDRVRQREPLLPVLDETDHGDEHNPEAYLERNETKNDVERALSRLSIAYRTVLILFYTEELQIKEIASILELPIGTVKTHLHRARRALRKVLTEQQVIRSRKVDR